MGKSIEIDGKEYESQGISDDRRGAGVLELDAPATEPARSPLPDLTRELVESMTAKNRE
jgi:hypothetical protein